MTIAEGGHPTSAGSASDVAIGMMLPVEGPVATPKNIVAFAREAERLGAQSVWVSDRILMPVAPPRGYPYSRERWRVAFQPDRLWLEPLSVLGLVAAVTERVEMGTNVLVLPYRNPIILARELATLDRLADGRVLLGVGVGWMREEFAALGIPFEERGQRCDEHIAVLRKLWSAACPVEFDGAFTSVSGMTLPAAPGRPGGPPILIGGNSRAALLRVARAGDGWLGVDMDAADARVAIDFIRQSCAGLGRSPSELVLSMKWKLGGGVLGQPETRATGLSAGRLIDGIARLRDAGIGQIVFDLLTFPEMMEGMQWLFSEVFPKCPGVRLEWHTGRSAGNAAPGRRNDLDTEHWQTVEPPFTIGT